MTLSIPRNVFFFLMSGWLDVRRFRDEGNVAEAMEEGCGIRGVWVSSEWSERPSTLISPYCSPDGYMQDAYTRCKGLNEIAPQVNHHCLFSPAPVRC